MWVLVMWWKQAPSSKKCELRLLEENGAMPFVLVRSPYAFTQEMTHYNVEASVIWQITCASYNSSVKLFYIMAESSKYAWSLKIYTVLLHWSLFLSLVSLFLSFRSTKESEASFSSPLPELLTSTLNPLVSECLLPWTKSCTSQVSVILTVFGPWLSWYKTRVMSS